MSYSQGKKRTAEAQDSQRESLTTKKARTSEEVQAQRFPSAMYNRSYKSADATMKDIPDRIKIKPMGAIVFLGSQRLGDFTNDSPVKIRPMLSSAYHSLHIELGMELDKERENIINRELFAVDPLVNGLTAVFVNRADPEFGKIAAAVADFEGDGGVKASDQDLFVITFLAAKGKHPKYFRQTQTSLADPVVLGSIQNFSGETKIISTCRRGAFSTYTYGKMLVTEFDNSTPTGQPSYTAWASWSPLFDAMKRLPFDSFLKKTEDLTYPEWLDNGDGTSGFAIAANEPAVLFTTPQQYYSLWAQACIYAGAYSSRQMLKSFAPQRQLKAKLEPFSTNMDHVVVKVPGEYYTRIGAALLPYLDVSVKVFLQDGSSADPRLPTRSWDGKVVSRNELSMGFTVQAPRPEMVAEQSRHLRLVVHIGEFDPAPQERLTSIGHFVDTSSCDRSRPMGHGTRSFSMFQTLMGRSILDFRGPNWIKLFLETASDIPANARRQIANSICSVHGVFQKDLNDGQKQVFKAALVGVTKATMIVIGYGGTGKTTVIPHVVVAMMHMGFKVMVTSRNSSALEHLMVAISKAITRCRLDDSLRSKMLLWQAEDVYERLDFIQQLVDKNKYRTTAKGHSEFLGSYKKLVGNPKLTFCMLPVMLAKELEKQDIKRPDASQYRSDVVGQVAKFVDNALYESNIAHYITRFIDEALLVGVVISAISSILKSKPGFEMAIIDEASQITEPECLPIRADSVIFAGDPKQLGTHEASAIASENPFGNMLEVSMLDRLRHLDGMIPVYELCSSFRSHPDILEPLSQIHYSGKLFTDVKNEWIHNTAIADFALDRLQNTWKGFPQCRNTLIALNSFPVKEDGGESYSSPLETNAGLDIVEVIVSHRGINLEDICINAAYGSATRCTKQEAIIRWGRDEASRLLIATADGLQGQDKHIVIHLVTAAFAPDEGKGLFGSTSNRRRSCVAMSRARQLNVYIGNHDYWRQRVPSRLDDLSNDNDKAIWDLVRYLEGKNAIYHDMKPRKTFSKQNIYAPAATYHRPAA